VVEGAPTEEPRPDASNARRQRTATRAIGACPVLLPVCCLNTRPRVVAHRCFTLPRSSILCGCINIPGRQVNAVWGGSIPYRMYDVCRKKAESLLGARRQNLPRLRVEKLGCATRSWPCLVTGLRVGLQVGPAVKPEASTGMPASVSSRPDLTGSQSPAYTYLKQHLQRLRIFNHKTWPCRKPFLAGKTFPSPNLKPPTS
jgi:hypothetical protein